MRGSALQCLAVVHKRLNGVCSLRSRKAFLCGLFALYNRNSKRFLGKAGVNIEHADSFFPCFLCGCMESMTLLPEELARAQKRAGGLFPAYNAAPLVIQLRQIPVGMNNILKVIAEKGL